MSSIQRSTAVVIVNYRTPELVVDCLRSLVGEKQREPGLRVIVVDNPSGDDSVAIISKAVREAGWDWVEVRPLDHNGGFSYGNNAAIRELLLLPTPPDFIWLLNPDTIVRSGAICPLIDFLERHPNVGIAGGRLEFPDGAPQTAAFRFPSLMGEFEDTIRVGLIAKALERFRVPIVPRNVNHRCDWVNGASMMIRREVFEEIGLMDDGYFLYFEETDFCRRAKDAGWRIWHVASSRVVHLEGQSTGVTGEKRALKRRPRYWFDSRARYYRKHHPGAYAFFVDLAWIVGYGLWLAHRRLRGKPNTDPPGFWIDFVRHAIGRWIGG